MTTKANSFRLQRLTKTVGMRDSSFSEYAPKETLKLAALNSINRTIKYNDLSFAEGKTDLHKLRIEPEIGSDIQYESAHQNLDSVRKNYDSVHKEKVKKQINISKLKDQKTKFLISEQEFIDNKNEGTKRVQNLIAERQKIKLMLKQAQTQKKVLLHMQGRLKHDKVVYDQRKFNFQKQLKFMKTQKEVFKKDGTDIHEADDRTNKVYKRYLKQLKAEKEERQAHIDSLQGMIEEKRRVNQLNEFRERQIMEIAERAMQDKDESEKNWEKLHITNKFIAKMLRDKMDKEMSKFFVVESAFKNIKISTGVNDAETLVHKFLNKQTAYGQLLGRIAENEKRIEELKKQTQYLLHEHKQNQAERQVLFHTKRVIPTIQKESKELNLVNNKLKKTNLLMQRLRNWVVKSSKKMNSVLGTSHVTSVGRQNKDIGEAFINFLSALTGQLEKTQGEVKMDKFDSNQKIKNEKKSVRITNLNKDLYEDQSDQDPNTNYEQNDLMHGQRGQIHRQNEKFMKILKVKADQMRKAKAQSLMPKKKEEKLPEKPKEEVQ